MNEPLRKIPINMPVNTSKQIKEKRKLLLTYIVVKCYMEKLNTKLPSLKYSFDKDESRRALSRLGQYRQVKQSLACLVITGQLYNIIMGCSKKITPPPNNFSSE